MRFPPPSLQILADLLDGPNRRMALARKTSPSTCRSSSLTRWKSLEAALKPFRLLIWMDLDWAGTKAAGCHCAVSRAAWNSR